MQQVESHSASDGVMRDLPNCQSITAFTHYVPVSATRFHVAEDRLITPMCSKCADALKVQTSPWTAAWMEEYWVQQVMES